MTPLRRRDVYGEPRPLFATCDTGLEGLLASELEALGATNISPLSRGVGFVADRELMWRVNLQSRVASRVLLPIAEFEAADKEELLAGATAAPWSNWFHVSNTIAVDASSDDSALSHTGYIAQVVKDGICDQFREVAGRRPDVQKKFPDVRINARLSGDRCILSLDTSGEALHRRGYRIEAGAAPLRESLAAACVLLSGWTPEVPLVDPMCGAGTLLVEAAMIATRTPPGLQRGRKGHFAFTHFYGHRDAAFTALLDELEDAIIDPPGPILGSDVNPEVLGQAARNAERAGVEEAIELAQQPVGAARPPAGNETRGIVISNPPYGHRLSDPGRLEALYATFGRTLKFEFGGWQAWVLVGDGAPIRKIGLTPDARTLLRNGPIPCELLHYDVFAGRPSLPDRGPRPDDRGGPRRDDRGGHRRDDRGGPRRDDRGGPRRDDRGGYRRDDRGGPRRDDRGGPRRDDRGGYRRDDRGGPRRDDRGGPRRDDRGGYRRDDRGGPRRDDRGGYRRDDRGGPRRDDRGGYRRDDRGGPRRDDRGGPRRDDWGGPRRDDRGGPRRDDRGGYRRDDRGGPRRDDRGGYRRDDRGGPRRDDRGGYRRDDRGGPRRDDRGGYRRDDRGGPRHDDRGGYRRDDRGGPRRDDRGGYRRDDRGGPRRDDRGGYRRDDRGGPRRDDRGGPRRDDRGGPRRDDRGGPRRDDRGGPRRDDRGGYRRDDRGGPRRDNRGGPRRDDRGGPRRDDRGGPRRDDRGGPRRDDGPGPRGRGPNRPDDPQDDS